MVFGNEMAARWSNGCLKEWRESDCGMVFVRIVEESPDGRLWQKGANCNGENAADGDKELCGARDEACRR